jgi:hypothetical protein
MIGTEWIFRFGHMSEISREVWDHAQQAAKARKEGKSPPPPLEAGTYLGTCRTWIGITTNPHCHISVWSPSDQCLIFCKYWVPLLTSTDLDKLDKSLTSVQDAVTHFDLIKRAFARDSRDEAIEATRAAFAEMRGMGDFPAGDPGAA